jgi:hypothetical protein
MDNEEVKNDLENENAIEALRAEMMDFIPNWGPQSDVRTIPEPKGDDQQCMILWAMSWHNIALIMAMMYACLPTTVHEFFELSNWRYVLYSALINTLWIDERSGLEYSLSFREASAVIAFFTGVRGGDKGCYLDGPYCCITSGDLEDGNLTTKGIAFIKSLGFTPHPHPRPARKILGYSTCNFDENKYNKIPPFVALPRVLQEAIEYYAELTEGIVALANKLAPCVQYREPDPEEKKQMELKRNAGSKRARKD